MKQRLDSHPVLITPDYNETLILAIELSNSKWVLAAQVPGLANVKNKRTIEPTVEALMAAIGGYRARAAKTGEHAHDETEHDPDEEHEDVERLERGAEAARQIAEDVEEFHGLEGEHAEVVEEALRQ